MYWLLLLISYASLRCEQWEIALLAGVVPVVFTLGALAYSAYDRLLVKRPNLMP